MPAQQRAHLGTSVTASWARGRGLGLGVVGGGREGKGRGGGICKFFYTFLHSPALCCTSPPGRAGSLLPGTQIARGQASLVGAEQARATWQQWSDATCRPAPSAAASATAQGHHWPGFGTDWSGLTRRARRCHCHRNCCVAAATVAATPCLLCPVSVCPVHLIPSPRKGVCVCVLRPARPCGGASCL